MKKKVIIEKAKRKGTEGILGPANSGVSIFTEDVKDDDAWADAVNAYLANKTVVEKGGPGSGHYGHAGRRGRRGRRGGSLPGGVAMSIRTGRDAAERQAAASGKKPSGPKPGTPGKPGPQEIDLTGDYWADDKLHAHILGSRDDLDKYAGGYDTPYGGDPVFSETGSVMYASKEARSNVKAQLVDDVYNRIPEDQRYDFQNNPNGISKDDVNQMVAQWAVDSNDNKPESLAMQQAASKEFGIALSDYQDKSIAQTKSFYPNMIQQMTDQDGNFNGPNNLTHSKQRAVLRAMYDNTQAQLASMGYKPGDTVTVFRGVMIEDPAGGYMKLPQGVMNYKDNVMASWSSQWNVAENFTATASPNVFSQQVPIENILSTCRTGFGCLTEAEIVVLASPGTQITITDVGR